MIRINDIIDKVSEYFPQADFDIIDRAYIYTARVHDGQVRLSGEPYLSHPLEVAGILADMKLDVVSVAAGLLHDVIEDTHAVPEEIEKLFGPEVTHIVTGVTKLGSLSFHSSRARQAGKAARAVSTARSTSDASANGTVRTAWPVALLVTSPWRDPWAGVSRPLIHRGMAERATSMVVMALDRSSG